MTVPSASLETIYLPNARSPRTRALVRAAACAINFPAWGRMCGRVRAALASGLYGRVSADELAFLNYFAEPIPGLDDMAAAVIVQEGAGYDDLVVAVRLLQEYEALFWDAVFARVTEV